MRRVAVAYAAALASFLTLDAVWLGVLARDFYAREIGALLLDTPNWAAALVFYAAYTAGILAFAVWPGLAAGSWRKTAGLAAGVGALAYGTYDLTNLATLQGFTLHIAMIDLLWGVVVTTVAAVAAHTAASRAR